MWGNGPESLPARARRTNRTPLSRMTLSPTSSGKRDCVEGPPRRWYGEDERTGRDEWCSEHRQHRLRIRERAWRTHSAHDPCLTMADRARLLRSRVAAGNDVDGRAFAERCEGDRHHFRFIISPDDAGDSGVYVEVRTSHQSFDGQAARANTATDTARHRRRGDRINRSSMHSMLHLLTAGHGTFETFTDVRYAAAFGGSTDISERRIGDAMHRRHISLCSS
jgi:hypothetical protein